jgi:hypothetical protein
MNAHAYSEDQLVEQPAIGLFTTLGWQTVSALEESFGAGGFLGRETRGEVVLVERLRAALGKFNPTLPPEARRNNPFPSPCFPGFAASISLIVSIGAPFNELWGYIFNYIGVLSAHTPKYTPIKPRIQGVHCGLVRTV